MEEVTLRPITLSDTDLIVKWRNSDAVRLNMYDQKILTAERHRDYFHKQIETGLAPQYIIEYKNNAVGTIFYKRLHENKVEIGLFIGDESLYGRGIGKKALNRLIDYIRCSGCKRIVLKVNRNNTRASNLYLHTGFEITDNTALFVEMALNLM